MMNQESFPKPLPVDPIPFDKWLRRTDRSESGRDAFFRGRDAEFKIFRDAALSLDDGVIGGGTMIFQGAPGAGKTALMLECMEAVRKHSTPDDPWVAVDIKPENLESAFEIVMLLVDAVNAESKRLSEMSSGSGTRRLESIMELGRKMYHDLSERGFGMAGISVGGKSTNNQEAQVFSQRVFQNAAGLLKNFHIMVFVDEAQNTLVKDTTKGVLNCLHDPPDKIPLLAAFFGLSDTEEMLRKCGLSRPPDERVVNLELLDHEEACNVIRSVFKAYSFTGSSDDQEIWVERLAELSQGWPQHINRVSVAACRVIVKNGSRIRNELLEEALKDGQKRKESYYATRLRSCSFDPSLYKKIALAANDTPDGVLSRPRLKELIVPLLEDSQAGFNNFLTNALHAGVLMETKEIPHHYWIPIPSFGEYLRKLPI
ncbi:MAG: hypothetical protein OXF73_11470 [Gammaproteobacteria bacterium]|nr:hypothetical protein [Gammaproteobacteria bacterium]